MPWKTRNLWISTIWYMWGCLVCQGGRIPFSRALNVKLLLIFWWAFAIIFYSSYGGTLKSHMTVLTKEQSIDTLYALKREISKGRYTCGVLKGSNLENEILDSNNPIYGDLAGFKGRNYVDLVESLNHGLLKTLSNNYAYIGTRGTTEFQVTKMGEDRFAFAKDTFTSSTNGIVLQKGNPCKTSFDKVITRIVRHGLMNKWTANVKEAIRKNVTIRPLETTLRPLQVHDLLGAFYFLLIGLCLSTFLLLVEIMYNNIK
ncbi:putative glutamate receptor [Tachypleus tridentatus]|uniref:putative glutamate receptor n=1 Tax=Tachypleus tridentatus TaxID=6853 RepID=UPI003FD6ABBB